MLANSLKLGGLVVVATNAGWLDTWGIKKREHWRNDPAWHCSIYSKPAPWKTEKEILSLGLKPFEMRRLYFGEWGSVENPALSEADIQAAVAAAKEMGWDGEMQGDEEGYRFFGAMDLSKNHDNSAVVIIGRHKDGHIRLAAVRIWVPPKGGTIDLQDVQYNVVELNRKFHRPIFAHDGYEAMLLIQQCQSRHGMRFQQVSFNGAPAKEMASELTECFTGKRIRLWRHEALLRDLRRLRIVQKPDGSVLKPVRTGESHCDSAIALAECLYLSRTTPGALQRANVWTGPSSAPERRDNGPWNPPDLSNEHLWRRCNSWGINFLTGKPQS
jgi:hypothetical protein